MNRVCEILNIKYPIVQAPMAWITSAELVAAVSNAGGLGVLGPNAGVDVVKTSVAETKEDMRTAIRKTRELTDKPFAVNYLYMPDDTNGFSQAMIDVSREENVKIIAFVGPCDTEEIKKLKSEGFTIIFRNPNPTVKSAIEAEKAGVDIIVATGCDEGGGMPAHSWGTMSITSILADAVSIPVMSAGAVVNSKFTKALSILGAEGAYVGTRFILSKECRAPEIVKQDILNTPADDLIEISALPLKWRTTPHKIGIEGLEENRKGNNVAPTGTIYGSMLKGDLDAGVISVCNTVNFIKSIDSCEEIVKELAKGFEE